MTHPLDSRALAEQWRGGDQDAARQLFDRYARRLVALSRQRISQRLASRVDPEDAVQSAFYSFFRRLRGGQFEIQGADDLWHLLVRITVCKTLRQIEHHRAGKRDPGREASSGEATDDRWRDVLSREPSPEAALNFQDQLDHFLAQLGPKEREIVEMRLAGYGTEEISLKLGTYDRKVRRVIEWVCTRAEQEYAAERTDPMAQR